MQGKRKRDGPQSPSFAWRIENFSTLKDKHLYSRTFWVGGNKWRVVIFLGGNSVDKLSIYLYVARTATLPLGWSRYAQFSLSVVNQVHSKFTATKDNGGEMCLLDSLSTGSGTLCVVVGQLREVTDEENNAELKLFLEDLRPVPPPVKTREEILLFFKLYDPLKEELRYVGRLFLKSSGKPVEILPKLNELAGFAPDEEIDLYEEIRFEPNVMCDMIDKKASFRFSELKDGDIICLQKSPLVETNEEYRYPDVPSFLEYVHNRQEVDELPRSHPMGSPSESPTFDDMDAYISRLASVVETDAPFDSTSEGSATASINPQSTFDEAKKFFIKMFSQDLSEIPDFAIYLAESILDLSKCCNFTSSQREELNNFKPEFLTLLETYKTSKHSLKVVEERMAEKQGTKNSLVEQVKINAFTFQTRRAVHKDLVSKKAELQQEIERLQVELANISEKDKSAEKEMKQLHGKMISLEQSRSSLLEEFSTLEAEKKIAKSTLSSLQQKWAELRRVFMEPNN